MRRMLELLGSVARLSWRLADTTNTQVVACTACWQRTC